MSRASRKWQHVEYALKFGQSGRHGFEDVKFVHNCLPESSLDKVNIATKIGGFKLSSPIIINAMTGGAGRTHEINRRLGTLARETGLPIAVGSQMGALKDPQTAYTYKVVREVNPHGLIFANLGAEANVEQAERAVEMIRADALQIHLNVMQELLMPEGDRNFEGALERIARIRETLGVPVIVKEVGFGMSREAIAKLLQIGITCIDVGGFGGTNFARIENARRRQPLDFLNDWGITTCASLLEASPYLGRASLIASGGIRHALDIAKSLALGASAVGMAGTFLKLVHDAATLEEPIAYVRGLCDDLRLIMTALGAVTIRELQQVPLVITGKTAEWAARRGIDLDGYARRNFRGNDRGE
ncbi:type 2 isopentenyl-diphosphate Delta-isomerase [Bacillaceae bacterium]